MESSMNGSGSLGLGITQQRSGPASPSISTSGNTLVDPDIPRTPAVTSSCQIWPTVCIKSLDWGNKKDPVYDLEKPCHGYPGLTKLICKHPGFEAFQSFKDLHIKSLLYYQAELDEIRKDLHIQEWVDHRLSSFDDAAKLSSRADILCNREGKADEEKSQMDLVDRMRTVLKTYSKIISGKGCYKC
jgi:hypothetical protein